MLLLEFLPLPLPLLVLGVFADDTQYALALYYLAMRAHFLD
jgi:hypothetical protein